MRNVPVYIQLCNSKDILDFEFDYDMRVAIFNQLDANAFSFM